MLGGFGIGREPSEDEFEFLLTLKPVVEGTLNKEFEIFIPIRIQSQVVAGLNYKIKYQVADS
jgi:hypothetical protein